MVTPREILNAKFDSVLKSVCAQAHCAVGRRYAPLIRTLSNFTELMNTSTSGPR